MSALRMMALFGSDRALSETVRGRALASVLVLKAQRAWIKPGAYAWWRYNDYVEAAQRKLIALRYPAKPDATSPSGEAVSAGNRATDEHQ